MKIKLQYIFILLSMVLFSIFYKGYGWTQNPWAAERLVWDDTNPELIGKKFLIIKPAAYEKTTESLPTPVKATGVVGYISINPDNKQECISVVPSYQSNGALVDGCDTVHLLHPDSIPTAEVFTIEKTYWLRLNFWSKSFRSDYKGAIVKNQKMEKFVFYFSNFEITNRPDFKKTEDENLDILSWNFFDTEIAYEKK